MAAKLIRETCNKHQIAEGTLTIHADRGSSMTSKPVALLCADLGLLKTHSRPYQSNDNPYSESNFNARSLDGWVAATVAVVRRPGSGDAGDGLTQRPGAAMV